MGFGVEDALLRIIPVQIYDAEISTSKFIAWLKFLAQLISAFDEVKTPATHPSASPLNEAFRRFGTQRRGILISASLSVVTWQRFPLEHLS